MCWRSSRACGPCSALMDGDALAAMEDLDRAGGDANVDFRADQRVGTE